MTNQILKWQYLLKNKCPRCMQDLDFKSDESMMMCTIKCGFMITPQKMNEMCAILVRQGLLSKNVKRIW